MMLFLCTIILLQLVSAGIGHGHVIRISKNNKKNECNFRSFVYVCKWDIILQWTYDF